MEQAIKANHDMIAREREIERMREKAGHDEAQALYNARKKGYAIGYASGFAETKARVEAIKAIATNMLKMNLSMDTIVSATGMTNEEWKQLNSNLEMLSDESNEEQEKEKGAPFMEQANKADRDEAQELYHAIAEGRATGKAEGIMTTVKNMLKMDLPMDMIVTATGLPHDEIEQLKPMDNGQNNGQG